MSRLQFDGQREGETFQFLFRRHIITAGRGMIFFIAMAAAGLIPVFLWPNNPYIFWVWLAFALIGLFGAAYAYLLWYYSIYIVTDQRIRQIIQKSLFKKSVIDFNFNKIQTISFHETGLFAHLFNYGSLIISTNLGDISFSLVQNPEKVYNLLQDLIGQQ